MDDKEKRKLGRKIAIEYREVCMTIGVITNQMGRELEALYDAAYQSPKQESEIHTKEKSDPVFMITKKILKMKVELEDEYIKRTGKLEHRKFKLKEIIDTSHLTARETDIFYYMYNFNPKNTQQIAEIIQWSIKTVERDLKEIYKKVGNVAYLG